MTADIKETSQIGEIGVHETKKDFSVGGDFLMCIREKQMQIIFINLISILLELVIPSTFLQFKCGMHHWNQYCFYKQNDFNCLYYASELQGWN